MIYKEIKFTNDNAIRIYKDYIARVQNSTKILNNKDRQEILMEINSHIYESLQNNSGESDEVKKLLNILEKIGRPEIFLKDLVAEKKLEESTKSFNPISIFKALILNLGNGISYILFFILYLLLFGFVFLIFAKIFDPEYVGFFYKNNEIFTLGKISSDTQNYSQYEKLGNLFIPVMLVLIVVFYFIITLFLKLKNTFRTKLS